MALTYGTVWGSWGDEKVETEDQISPLGTRMVLPDGRTFYYAKNSSAAITTAGMIVDGIALVGAHDMDVPANINAAGVTAVSVEVPTTDLTKDQYKDGYLVFNDGPGEGEVYRIASHPAHDASDDNTVIITLDEPIRTALTTSSLFALVYNAYTDIKLIDGDGTMTTGALGVTQIPVTASYYCWIQTMGICSVALGAVVGIRGDALQFSQASGESGRAELYDLSGEDDVQSIGTAIGVPSVDTDKQLCMLTIRA